MINLMLTRSDGERGGSEGDGGWGEVKGSPHIILPL